MVTPKKLVKNNNTSGIFRVYVNAAIPTSCHILILGYGSFATPTHPTDFELKKKLNCGFTLLGFMVHPLKTLARDKSEFLGLRFYICISWRPWWINL